MSSQFLEEQGKLPSDYYFSERGSCVAALDDIVWDLFNTLYSIYYADIRTKRTADAVVSVDLLVKNPEQMQDICDELLDIVLFMTGRESTWSIGFRSVPEENVLVSEVDEEQLALELEQPPRHIGLLSGGLDSFAGLSIDEQNNESDAYKGVPKPHYVTVWTNNTEWGRVTKGFDGRFDGFSLTKHYRPDTKKEHTMQRTRSLAFFAFGVVEALLKGAGEVVLTENGVMSLNPSLGSRHPTKTTHPKVITAINALLGQLGVGVQLKHRGRFETKGQLIERIADEHRPIIAKTRTCGRNRQDHRYDGEGHCGACLPCVLRRISIVSAGFEEFDVMYQDSHKEDDKLYADFASSLAHYIEFKRLIDEGGIASELRLRREWIVPHGFDEVKAMLSRFSEEVEMFVSRVKAGL